ncbi:SPOR domain-containing protein [Polaribacter aquimarinus]|uniref:SPOR domain-containing protein n=1 Tax=Polaribacter aquimarinus TaxID=2100726 RepID=A0A2U2JCM2_9FLAO|nr:SPOR domain-containing protein [Polaribacter aquimarinus]PWG06088.1 hypothetical protein DIS07_06555 [Polaribacter aquimarinus]
MKKNFKLISLTLLICILSLNSYAQDKTVSTKEIKDLIAKKRAFNKKHGFGYRIQLYNGNEQKARKFRARFRIEFPNNEIKLVYRAPEWKVQVGNYKTKLEADKDLIKFQEKFSGIIVVPMGK